MANTIGRMPIVPKTIAADDTATEMVGANTKRKFLGIYNESGQDIYIAFENDSASDPTDSTTMIKMVDGANWENNVLELVIMRVVTLTAAGAPLAADAIKVAEGF